MHAPSQARALVQEAKRGTRPLGALAEEARAIADPGFAAEALLEIARQPGFPAAEASRVLDEVGNLASRVPRDWRRAEVLAELARRAPGWRRDVDTAAFAGRLAQLVLALEGKPFAQASPLAARASPADAPALLRRALTNGEEPLRDAKAILAAAPTPEALKAAASWTDRPVAARLVAYHHGLVPGALPQALALAAGDADVLRGIAAGAQRLEDLEAVRHHLPDGEARARLLAALAARADRLGDAARAGAWFQEGLEVAATLPEGKGREGVQRNLEAGLARLGGAPSPTTERGLRGEQGTPLPGIPVPVAEPADRASATASAGWPDPPRDVFALVDTYDGKLGEAHLRAAARAAPLCVAFGLDLGLYGFPGRLEDLVAKAEAETSIGEGGGYLTRLAAAGRIRWHPGAAPPQDWDGFPVATTPKPASGKAADLAGARLAAAGRPLVVLVGLGKRGLPGAWLKAAACHWEATGQGISLETATAMGVLAALLGGAQGGSRSQGGAEDAAGAAGLPA